MKRAIIIHGWEGTPEDEWLPWLGKTLKDNGWKVEIPAMPNTKKPKLDEWMKTLVALHPDKDTLLIGHSLANALILHFLEQKDTTVKGVIMVAAWDWLMEDVKEFHQTFFETEFDYEAIKKKQIPLIIVNSTTDPWIEFEQGKNMAPKLDAKFIAIENAGHFMGRDGYTEFPKLIEILEKEFN